MLDVYARVNNVVRSDDYAAGTLQIAQALINIRQNVIDKN